MKLIFTTLCLAFLLSSCGTKEVTNVQVPKLNGTYKISKVTGTELGMIEPTLIADTASQRISGYAGCNTYNASYTLTAANLTFTNLALTRMACIQGMEEERKFTQALEKVNRHTLDKGKLTLYHDETVLIIANSIDM